MAVKNRPGSAKSRLSQQTADLRRGAPGKHFIGETAGQSRRARQSQRERVERMAEVDAAERRAREVGVPLTATVAELIQSGVHLGMALLRAPLRMVRAARHARA